MLNALLTRRRRHLESEGRRHLEVLAGFGEVVPPSLHPYVDPQRCIGSGTCVAACPEKDILRVIAGRAHVVNPLACVGHGQCAASCPVGAIELVYAV